MPVFETTSKTVFATPVNPIVQNNPAGVAEKPLAATCCAHWFDDIEQSDSIAVRFERAPDDNPRTGPG